VALDEAQIRSKRALSLIHAEMALILADLRASITVFHTASIAEKSLTAAREDKSVLLLLEERRFDKTLMNRLKDTMLLQDRLAELKISRIQSQCDHATARVRLQLATGNLFEQDAPLLPFDIKKLTALPSVD